MKSTSKNNNLYNNKANKENTIIPKVVWLTTNGTCNSNCKWCYAKQYTQYNKMMDLQQVDECIDFLIANKIKKVTLIGGEPTINPNIDKIIKKLSSNNINVSMATNGRKFADYSFAKKILDSGIKSVNISIKGSSEEEYLKNTNAPGFEEMIEGYNNLVKLNANVSLSYVLCDTDYTVFDKFWDMVQLKKLNNVFFQFYKPNVDLLSDEGPSIFELAELCKYVYNKVKNSNINYAFEMSLPLCVLDSKMLEEMINHNKIKTCCHITKGLGLVFDPDFNILPCNHFVNTPLNTKKIEFNKIIDFWNSSTVKEFRNIIKHYPSIKCSLCSKWKECGGGCMLRWLKDKPDNIVNDKYCINMKGGD